jgi:hypothetical protein
MLKPHFEEIKPASDIPENNQSGFSPTNIAEQFCLGKKDSCCNGSSQRGMEKVVEAPRATASLKIGEKPTATISWEYFAASASAVLLECDIRKSAVSKSENFLAELVMKLGMAWTCTSTFWLASSEDKGEKIRFLLEGLGIAWAGPEKVSGDYQPLDVICAFVDLGDYRVAVPSLHAASLGIALSS